VLAFEYGDRSIAFSTQERGFYDADTRRLLVRDRDAEATAVTLLHKVGFRQPKYYYSVDGDFELSPHLLPKATHALLNAGWSVEAEGKLYRKSSDIRIEVTSGIDWFDLEGKVHFDDQVAPLPRLLQALKKGENTIQLDDGTFGMVPEEWLNKYGMLADLGTVEGDHLRFSRIQTGLLDALLAAMPEASCDEAFRQAATELRSFEGIKPVDPPATFTGTLREYQREGLGWLQFLERFRFGGCLADDMGLGKTVQVLALLAGRYQAEQRQMKRPTMIVAPRSLIFNWRQEAARFAPHLKVLDHTGLGRGKSAEGFSDSDVILTTYGTLRRDVMLFKDAQFDYCILDEAQIVKNAATDQSKAVRLINANHRLVLSGTPIENHLGELWTLFEFLNPGMLGRASLFQLAGPARNPASETRAILARGLRPFILRRTKQQVAKDLPAKTEQTLYCELEPEQRRLYDELRDHYRLSLLKTIDAIGMNRAKIQVLEALLRLRQAACHPFLVDKKSKDAPSAKLDALFPYLQEAMSEGQKILVFSQFTSFLAIVRSKLDRDGLPYEYLDGKTRNRQAKVERFQNDPDCKLFLISLKAGGVGLNLTAAEYVFLLDPWWNPAVEAQAIDRTHRIGQTKPVFAYRIIAKDTVEEKVLELQNTKRNLADAILTADNSTLSSLKREDLEMLLS
jgi:SNF2 family DNA or RNA helicase